MKIKLLKIMPIVALFSACTSHESKVIDNIEDNTPPIEKKIDLGKNLFKGIISIAESETNFRNQLISIEELRTYSKIDTLPVQKKTLDELFTITKEEYNKTFINYKALIEEFESYGFSNPHKFKFIDSRQFYQADEPSRIQLENGEKYGDDLPCIVVTAIFEYDNEQYSMDGAFIKNQNGHHLVHITPSIKEL